MTMVGLGSWDRVAEGLYGMRGFLLMPACWTWWTRYVAADQEAVSEDRFVFWYEVGAFQPVFSSGNWTATLLPF